MGGASIAYLVSAIHVSAGRWRAYERRSPLPDGCTMNAPRGPEEDNMLTHSYDYQGAVTDAAKVNWQVDDLIGPEKRLDFSKPFLPEALAGVRGLVFLSGREKLLLNQIRGNSYLYLFGFVEEFILPFVLDEARAATPGGDPLEVRAMVTFADEEAKHIHLFHRFAEEFAAGFHSPCGVIGPAAAVA